MTSSSSSFRLLGNRPTVFVGLATFLLGNGAAVHSEEVLVPRYQSQTMNLGVGLSSENHDAAFTVDSLNYEFCNDAGLVLLQNGYDQLLDESTQTRMGFLYDGNFGLGWQDEKDLSSIDSIRGPGAILYGINSTSRVLNIQPRLADGNSEYKISTFFRDDEYDSGYFRTSLEAQSSLFKNEEGDFLAYRFAASSTDWNGLDIEHYTGQLRYKTERLDGLVEFQSGGLESGSGESDEQTILANIDFDATDKLSFSAGAFITDLENDVLPVVGLLEKTDTQEYKLGANYRFESSGFLGTGSASHSISLGLNEFIREYDANSTTSEVQSYSRSRTLGTSLMYSGSLMEGKLGVLLGYRLDDYNYWEDRNSEFVGRFRASTLNHDNVGSGFVGLSYALTDTVSVYTNFSDGNTLARIGNMNGVYSDSNHREIGIKFNALEGRLFGRVSAYSDSLKGVGEEDVVFSSEAFFRSETTGGLASIGADYEYLEVEGLDVSWSNLLNNGDIAKLSSGEVFVSYDKLDAPVLLGDGSEVGITWRSVLERAFADYAAERGSAEFVNTYGSSEYGERLFYPLGLYETSSVEQETDGIDLNLSYLIQPNWEILLNYSYQVVDFDSFRKPAGSEIASGGSAFGTEYDLFVRTFGREAFAFEEVYATDDEGNILLDPNGNRIVKEVLYNGESIRVGDALDSVLITGSEGLNRELRYSQHLNYFSLHSDYAFLESRLSGLSFLSGVVYRDNAVQIKEGDFLYDSLPYSSELLSFNLGLKYEWEMSNTRCRVQLNVNNVTDEQVDAGYWHYESIEGDRVEETTKVNIYPRSYQLRLTAEF